MPVILIDSVYRKDENYYPKVFLGKLIHNIFLEKYKKFWFLELWKFLLKYKSFLSLRLESSISVNVRNFSEWNFLFYELGKLPPEI